MSAPVLSRNCRRLLAGMAAAAAATTLALGGGAAAAPARLATTTDPAQAGAGYLAGRLVGGNRVTLSFNGTAYYDAGTSADVVFALAASGSGRVAIGRVLDYLAVPANLDSYVDLSNADGTGPYAGAAAKASLAFLVGGRTLPAGLASAIGRQCTAVQTTSFTEPYCPAVGAGYGTYSGISESFIVLTSARLGSPLAADGTAMTWFLSLQCPGGGFTSLTEACAAASGADVDATGYAAMALAAQPAPTPTQRTALARALRWLRTHQNTDGSWTAQNVHNSDSTGLAAAALAGAATPSAAARRWLAAQQIHTGPTVGKGATRGGLHYAGGSDEHSTIKATADGLLGLTGRSLATLTAAGSAPGVSVLALDAPVLPKTALAGSSVTLRASGFAAGEKVRVQIHSAPRTLGTAVAGRTGSITARVRIPAGLAAGSHVVTFTGLTSTLSTSGALRVRVPAAAASTPQLPNTGVAGRRLTAVGATGLALLLAGAALIRLGRRPSRT